MGQGDQVRGQQDEMTGLQTKTCYGTKLGRSLR
jgi:hypothetical protein